MPENLSNFKMLVPFLSSSLIQGAALDTSSTEDLCTPKKASSPPSNRIQTKKHFKPHSYYVGMWQQLKKSTVRFRAFVKFSTSSKHHGQGVIWKRRFCQLQRCLFHHCETLKKEKKSVPKRSQNVVIKTRQNHTACFTFAVLWSKVVFHIE